ncbi:hypothetical protein D1872_322360 [compost metagenome]
MDVTFYFEVTLTDGVGDDHCPVREFSQRHAVGRFNDALELRSFIKGRLGNDVV